MDWTGPKLEGSFQSHFHLNVYVPICKQGDVLKNRKRGSNFSLELQALFLKTGGGEGGVEFNE